MIYRSGRFLKKHKMLDISSHAVCENKESYLTSLDGFAQKGNTIYGVFPGSALHVLRNRVSVVGVIPTVQKLEPDPLEPRSFKADLSKYGYICMP